MKLAPYPKYKDSGVEWLGDIPEEWEVIRIKSLISNNKNGYWGEEEQGDENDIYCIRVADFDYDNFGLSLKNLTVRNLPNNIQKKLKLQPGDLLIEKSGGGEKQPIGRVVYFNENIDAICSNFIEKLQTTINTHSNYMKYVFSWLYTIGLNTRSIKQTTGLQNLDLYSYLCEKISIPTEKLQIKIADFLDHKTSKIDELIKKNEKLIELLKEKRQAIISHAVTKGLDPNAKMKGSGIKWLGEIPEGWKIKRIKHIAKEKFKNGIFKKKDFYGSGVKLINVFDVYRQNFYIDLNSLDHIEATKKEVKIYSVEAGDILFVRSSLKLEGVGASVCVPYINEPLIFECHLVKMQLSFEIVPGYLINFLNANVVRQRFIALANTVTMATLGQSSLSTLEVALPPILEQLAIVDYPKRETTKIDRVINKIQSQNETLKEYRQALISNVVTGKVKINEDQ